MTTIAVDLSLLSEAFRELSDQVCELWEGDEEPSPPLVQKAMLQLLDILERHEAGVIEKSSDNLGNDDVDELGDYGLTLIQEMSSYAADLGQEELSFRIEDLTFPFAVWLARKDCEIKNLAPIVNAFARSANDIRDPSMLKQLFTYINEIIDNLSPMITQDLEKTDPMRPWRILIINRAIIATRSHDAELMEMAFKSLVESLPEEAARFFEEGLEQMHLIDYPEHVQKLMQHYYLMYGTPQTLH